MSQKIKSEDIINLLRNSNGVLEYKYDFDNYNASDGIALIEEASNIETEEKRGASISSPLDKGELEGVMDSAPDINSTCKLPPEAKNRDRHHK